VAQDELGKFFLDDLKRNGIDTNLQYENCPQGHTGHCLVMTSPDAQRTMNTFLGASTELGPDDIDAQKIAAAHVLYIEGYQWDTPGAKAAIRKACQAAKGAGRQVALSLSDPFVVDRHRGDLLTLIAEDVDILFGNEEEIFRLYEATHLEAAIERVRGSKTLAIMTRSAKGAVAFDGQTTIAVGAEPVEKVVDTTGAGDLFAAGFLYGYTHGRDLTRCLKIGSLAAAEVISHMGARPEIPLRDLLTRNGL